ncbi:MAG: hypothetical protein N3D09_05045 [Archaeoglobaceae archaeon]|nr:hypothetical protein [Archaeoglobaceae archaeon]
MFEEVVNKIREYLEKRVKSGLIEEYSPSMFREWGKGKSIIIGKDLAYELGKYNSALLILWGKAEDKIYLSSSCDGSLAIIVISDIMWSDVMEKYECFRLMRTAFYNLELSGVTIRSLPSQLKVWLRVGKYASEQGFSLGILGRAIIDTMKSLKFIKTTDVIILTSKRDFEALNDVFARAKKITDAMIRMYEEKVLNCEECDYKDVCSEIPELKMIRERIGRV